MSNRVILFRSIVFILALGYWFYQFFSTDPGYFGAQFRFLTIWTLTANVIVAAQMLRLSLGHSKNEMTAFVSLVVVLNFSVVFNYWRIYLADPTNFYRDGDSADWWQEYYLHLLGPILVWIDAFLILGVFRKLRGVLIATLIIGVNDMELSSRFVFYCAITVCNLVFILIGWGIARMLGRRADPTNG